jgi:hypothetical protein
MNKGEPITGNGKLFKGAGSLDMVLSPDVAFMNQIGHQPPQMLRKQLLFL